MENDEFEYKYNLLIKEWDYTQNHIGRFDTILYNIRGWAVTLFGIVLSISVSQKTPHLVLFNIIPVLLFWIMDALNKNFQRKFIFRSKAIEEYLSGDDFKEDIQSRKFRFETPNLSNQFRKGTFIERIKDVYSSALLRNVIMTYIPMILLCIFSYVILKYAR
jgi:hypothetical protein